MRKLGPMAISVLVSVLSGCGSGGTTLGNTAPAQNSPFDVLDESQVTQFEYVFDGSAGDTSGVVALPSVGPAGQTLTLEFGSAEDFGKKPTSSRIARILTSALAQSALVLMDDFEDNDISDWDNRPIPSNMIDTQGRGDDGLLPACTDGHVQGTDYGYFRSRWMIKDVGSVDGSTFELRLRGHTGTSPWAGAVLNLLADEWAGNMMPVVGYQVTLLGETERDLLLTRYDGASGGVIIGRFTLGNAILSDHDYVVSRNEAGEWSVLMDQVPLTTAEVISDSTYQTFTHFGIQLGTPSTRFDNIEWRAEASEPPTEPPTEPPAGKPSAFEFKAGLYRPGNQLVYFISDPDSRYYPTSGIVAITEDRDYATKIRVPLVRARAYSRISIRRSAEAKPALGRLMDRMTLGYLPHWIMEHPNVQSVLFLDAPASVPETSDIEIYASPLKEVAYVTVRGAGLAANSGCEPSVLETQVNGFDYLSDAWEDAIAMKPVEATLDVLRSVHWVFGDPLNELEGMITTSKLVVKTPNEGKLTNKNPNGTYTALVGVWGSSQICGPESYQVDWGDQSDLTIVQYPDWEGGVLFEHDYPPGEYHGIVFVNYGGGYTSDDRGFDIAAGYPDAEAMAYLQDGHDHLDSGDWRRAIESYGLALDVADRRYSDGTKDGIVCEALYSRAVAYRVDGQLSNAIEDYRAVIFENWPQDVIESHMVGKDYHYKARLGLAHTYERLGLTVEATEVYEGMASDPLIDEGGRNVARFGEDSMRGLLPDLVVLEMRNLGSLERPNGDKVFTLQALVGNGDASTYSWTRCFVYDSDNADGPDRLIGSFELAPLDPFAMAETRTFEVVISDDETHYVHIHLDSRDHIQESQEDNNSGVLLIQSETGPPPPPPPPPPSAGVSVSITGIDLSATGSGDTTEVQATISFNMEDGLLCEGKYGTLILWYELKNLDSPASVGTWTPLQSKVIELDARSGTVNTTIGTGTGNAYLATAVRVSVFAFHYKNDCAVPWSFGTAASNELTLSH